MLNARASGSGVSRSWRGSSTIRPSYNHTLGLVALLIMLSKILGALVAPSELEISLPTYPPPRPMTAPPSPDAAAAKPYVGRVEIHDVRDVGDIEAARSHVGRNLYAHAQASTQGQAEQLTWRIHVGVDAQPSIPRLSSCVRVQANQSVHAASAPVAPVASPSRITQPQPQPHTPALRSPSSCPNPRLRVRLSSLLSAPMLSYFPIAPCLLTSICTLPLLNRFMLRSRVTCGMSPLRLTMRR